MSFEKYGCWIADGVRYQDKYEALIQASKINADVSFWYHNNIWSNFNLKNLGKIPLSILYRDRAQQIRDNYDYLILSYSGGADSHNVLRSFIDNNIKLDEVCVKWPKPLTDGKFYKSNNVDRSAKNSWSEWDYCVKPVLEWLSKNRPEIKISIKDTLDKVDNVNMDSLFDNGHNPGWRAGIILNAFVSDSESTLIDAGKKVAHIYGTDKPFLYTFNDRVYMFFSDLSFTTVSRSFINPNGAECFYWTPDLPLLAYEQAYQMFLYYKENVEQRKFLFSPETNKDSSLICNQMQQQIAKTIIYDTWDNRFQADKPTSDARLDKFFWLFESSELTRIKDQYVDNVIQRNKVISDRFLSSPEDNIQSTKTLITDYFYVGTF